MAYIRVDLDEFDLDDLITELELRYKYSRNRSDIDDFIKSYISEDEYLEIPKNISMVDQMKIDFLIENLDKIKLQDLENLIQ